MMRFVRKIAAMDLTTLQRPAHRILTRLAWCPSVLLVGLVWLALSQSRLPQTARAQACPQWDVTGLWSGTQQGNGYKVNFAFAQTGTNVTGSAVVIDSPADAPTGTDAWTRGNLTGTLVGDQLNVTVSWSNGKNTNYSGTISQGALHGTTGGVKWDQTGGPTTCVGGTPSTIMLWTVNDAGTRNPPQYHISDNIQVCFSTPSLGASVLTDVTADGNNSVLYQSGGDAGSTCPVTGTVSPPLGKECIFLDFTPVQGGAPGATTRAQTCWVDVP